MAEEKRLTHLMLSRRPGERVWIDHPDGCIWISVEDIRGDKVRLGIHAPPSVRVHREEVQARACGGPYRMPPDGENTGGGPVG